MDAETVSPPETPTILNCIDLTDVPPPVFSNLSWPTEERECGAASQVTALGVESFRMFDRKVTPFHKSSADKIYFISSGRLEILVLDEQREGGWTGLCEGSVIGVA